MGKFVKWIKETIGTIVDSDKESRVSQLVEILRHGIHTQRKDFHLASAVSGLDYRESDLELAKERVFDLVVAAQWRDGQIVATEQATMHWVSQCLELSDQASSKVRLAHARKQFAVALAQAMDDGVLTAEEERRLANVASAVGYSLADFTRGFFREESEGFLRGVFAAAVFDKVITAQEWNAMLNITAKLGVTQAEFLYAVRPQARQFVEHILADAKSDGQLSQLEEQSLFWLAQNLGLPEGFRQYIAREVEELRALTLIDECRLPVVTAPAGFETRAGEIVHCCRRATYQHFRPARGELKMTEHPGTLIVTDNRLVFFSTTKSEVWNYRRIVSHDGAHGWIAFAVEGKPACRLLLELNDSLVPYAVFRTALAMANQTRVQSSTSPNSRHIPRDVRQRVWQRYGGRCAECNADDYLEFDHIVPVAKGGSSSDINVQLLCRRCNGKKSDRI